MISSEDDLRNCDEVCLRIDCNTSVKDDISRLLVVGCKFILSDLNKLAYSFGLMWNFCTTRSGRAIKCNRATRYGSRVNQGLTNVTSITCGCDWDIRFRSICRNNNKISDPVVITGVSSVHSNTYNPSFVGRFVLSRTRSGDYKRCGDEVLREIMVQMDIDPFVNVRAMTELLQKTLPDKNDIDMYRINNVRIRARKKKLELDFANI